MIPIHYDVEKPPFALYISPTDSGKINVMCQSFDAVGHALIFDYLVDLSKSGWKVSYPSGETLESLSNYRVLKEVLDTLVQVRMME